MQVILKDNVSGLGQKDDIKEVKSGYWRNFLLPHGLAVEATSGLLEQAEKRSKEREKQQEEQEKKLALALKDLKEKVLIIEAKADEKGSLFEGIGAEKIIEALKEQMKMKVSVNTIELKEPIKKIGQHEVKIKNIVLKIEVKQF